MNPLELLLQVTLPNVVVIVLAVFAFSTKLEKRLTRLETLAEIIIKKELNQ